MWLRLVRRKLQEEEDLEQRGERAAHGRRRPFGRAAVGHGQRHHVVRAEVGHASSWCIQGRVAWPANEKEHADVRHVRPLRTVAAAQEPSARIAPAEDAEQHGGVLPAVGHDEPRLENEQADGAPQRQHDEPVRGATGLALLSDERGELKIAP